MFRNFGVMARTSASRAKQLTLPLSILAHAIALGLLVVVPLLWSDGLPEPARVSQSALVVHTALPAPPPPPAPPAKRPSKRVHMEKPRPVPTPTPPADSLVAPVDVTPLPETDASDILDGLWSENGVEGGSPDGIEGGVPGGVEGGTPGGIVGGVIGGVPSPEPPAPIAPVRVGGQIEPPRKLHHVAPEYPALARRAHVEALVILEAIIDPLGQVSEVRILRGQPLLDEAAVEAVRQWVYSPTLLNGVPVPVVMTVTVNFHLK